MTTQNYNRPNANANHKSVIECRPYGEIDNWDALSGMRRLPTNSITAMITDPPYAVGMASWDKALPDINIWKEAHRVMKPGAFAVVAAAPRLAHRLAGHLEDSGFVIRDTLVWHYTQSFPGALGVEGPWRSNLKTNHEPWIVAQKPIEKGLTLRQNWKKWGTGCVKTGKTGSKNWKTNLITCGKPKKRERNLGTGYLPFPYTLPVVKSSGAWSNSAQQANTHPTVKPLALMRSLVQLFAPNYGAVLDPFLGSGTTGMAAVAEGNDFIGYEIDFGYWNLASERIHFALDYPHLLPEAA